MAEDDAKTIQCNVCGTAMRLAKVTPGLGGLPELRTFQCNACGHVDTIEREND